MKLSIVTTLYGSEEYIYEFHQRISDAVRAIQGIGNSYEIIYVDDGSPDNSFAKALAIANDDDRVVVVELSKNHGHHRAMMVGLEQATGDHVFLIDSDLEEEPENLTLFWSELADDEEIDLIYGVQRDKSGNILKKSFSLAFYKVFNFLSYVQIPDSELVSRLMTRKFVQALLQYTERELFIPGIWADVGFKRKEVLTNKVFDGESSYTLSKRLAMAVDAITSFSTKPLQFIFYLGLIISLFSILFAIYLIANKLIFGVETNGWTSILTSLYLIGGIIIFSIGTVGLYLSRIFSEVKQRPNSIIRSIVKTSGDSHVK